MTIPRTLLLVTCILATTRLIAEGPLRAATSENERFELRIEPGRRGGDGSGCSARLLDRGRKRWERPLVNDVAPVAAAVSDDGRFVVTLDEYRRGGARHALVFYGDRGQLLRHFVLADILTREEWKHVRKGKRSVDWLAGAEYAFQADPPEFQLDLAWGRTVRIDLRTLQIVREKGRERDDLADIPKEFQAVFAAATEDGAMDPKVARQLTPEQLAALVQQIKAEDPEFDAAGAGVEEILAAAHELDLDWATTLDTGATPNPSRDAATAGQAGEESLPPEPAALDAADSTMASIIPPRPDPAAPVNYIEWANELGVVDGPDAKPFYDAAVASFVEFQGDSEVFGAALDGDPAALASPEIVSWLAANQSALQQFEAGAALERKGWHFESDDGSLLGVLLPQLPSIRQLAKAAVIQAHALEQEGRFDEAIDRYAATIRAGAHTGQGPTLIENLVGIAVQNLATQQILDLAARPESDQIDFAALARKLETSFIPSRPMAETMQFERAGFMDTIQRIFTIDPATGEAQPDMAKARQFVALSSDGSLLKQFGSMWTLAHTPFEDHVTAGNEFYDSLHSAMAKPYAEGRFDFDAIDQKLSGPGLNPLLRVLAPSLSRAAYLNARHQSTTRATRLVTNILAYRQQHGRLPETLDVFADRGLVEDPVTGGRFVYRLTPEGGFTLYSAGKDGVDNGGVHDPKAETNDYLYWPRPAKK